MKSTIKIDLDYDNLPVVVINFQSSEDVRDKMVGKFISNTFTGDPNGYAEGICRLTIQHDKKDGAEIIIRSLNLDELNSTLVSQIIDIGKKFHTEIKEKSFSSEIESANNGKHIDGNKIEKFYETGII
jgi:hypothetical protein